MDDNYKMNDCAWAVVDKEDHVEHLVGRVECMVMIYGLDKPYIATQSRFVKHIYAYVHKNIIFHIYVYVHKYILYITHFRIFEDFNTLHDGFSVCVLRKYEDTRYPEMKHNLAYYEMDDAVFDETNELVTFEINCFIQRLHFVHQHVYFDQTTWNKIHKHKDDPEKLYAEESIEETKEKDVEMTELNSTYGHAFNDSEEEDDDDDIDDDDDEIFSCSYKPKKTMTTLRRSKRGKSKTKPMMSRRATVLLDVSDTDNTPRITDRRRMTEPVLVSTTPNLKKIATQRKINANDWQWLNSYTYWWALKSNGLPLNAEPWCGVKKVCEHGNNYNHLCDRCVFERRTDLRTKVVCNKGKQWKLFPINLGGISRLAMGSTFTEPL
ncbi:MAG: hypothetical protein GY714_23255 [Desulfobacterales bacterium]|nr:hypothetical protein [Desulfobacterales bacterium]